MDSLFVRIVFDITKDYKYSQTAHPMVKCEANFVSAIYSPSKCKFSHYLVNTAGTKAASQ